MEKKTSNFSYLAYYKIELFFKKFNEKQFLKISHTFMLIKNNFPVIHFFSNASTNTKY